MIIHNFGSVKTVLQLKYMNCEYGSDVPVIYIPC